MKYADVQLAVKTNPMSGIDTYTINTSETKYNALNLYSTYKLDIGKHNASIMAGFNQESSWYGYLNTSIDQQAVPSVPSFGGGTGTKNISEGYEEYAIRGAFARLTYSYGEHHSGHDCHQFYPAAGARGKLGYKRCNDRYNRKPILDIDSLVPTGY